MLDEVDERNREVQRLEQRRVAQAPATLLELGLEQERGLAEAVVPVADGIGEDRQPPRRPLRPSLAGPPDQVGAEVGVARDEPGVEEPEHRLEVAVGRVERLTHRPHTVVEVDPGVPDRIPDPTGDLLDVAPAPVHEQHVEVAPRAELPAPVRAGGQDDETAGVAVGVAAAARRAIRRPMPQGPG